MILHSFIGYFDEKKYELIPTIRPKHLEYIAQNIKHIHYGGIMKNQISEIEGILMILKFEDIIGAKKFIENDPYFTLYKSFELKNFDQRIKLIEPL